MWQRGNKLKQTAGILYCTQYVTGSQCSLKSRMDVVRFFSSVVKGLYLYQQWESLACCRTQRKKSQTLQKELTVNILFFDIFLLLQDVGNADEGHAHILTISVLVIWFTDHCEPDPDGTTEHSANFVHIRSDTKQNSNSVRTGSNCTEHV